MAATGAVSNPLHCSWFGPAVVTAALTIAMWTSQFTIIPAPIAELARLYAIHRLTYFRSDPEQLAVIDTAIANELQQILHARGFYKGAATGLCDESLLKALRDFMGWENYDERIRNDALIDLEVLADIRCKHALWLQTQNHGKP